MNFNRELRGYSNKHLIMNIKLYTDFCTIIGSVKKPKRCEIEQLEFNLRDTVVDYYNDKLIYVGVGGKGESSRGHAITAVVILDKLPLTEKELNSKISIMEDILYVFYKTHIRSDVSKNDFLLSFSHLSTKPYLKVNDEDGSRLVYSEEERITKSANKVYK